MAQKGKPAPRFIDQRAGPAFILLLLHAIAQKRQHVLKFAPIRFFSGHQIFMGLQY
jgi:hypothetical protein